MSKFRLFPISLALLLMGSNTSQDLLQKQIELLELRHRLLPPSPARERLQLQILSLRRQLAREIEQEQRRQQQQEQRQREREQRQQEREQRQREREQRRQQILNSLHDLLILQTEELQRIEREYAQMQSLYPLGLIPEAQWNMVQRRLNVQRERIQRTQNRIQELSLP